MVSWYLKIVFVGGLIATFGVLIGATVNGNLPVNFWIFRCSADGYQASHYLSYCGDQAYGDYEHLALIAPLEPEAIAHLKKADVLFLGNSKAKRAFNDDAAYRYFNARNVAPYNLGFGYGEYDLFPLALIKKYQLRPKALVINADYFFYNAFSTAAKTAIRSAETDTGLVSLKRWVQHVHQDWCGKADKNFLADNICKGTATTLFRSRINGQTVYRNVDVTAAYPAQIDEQIPISNPALYIENARRFLAQIETPPSCVFLTVVPSIKTDKRIAKIVSQALGIPYIDTDVTPYITYDGNHLQAESAERWAIEFLQKADRQMSACLSTP